MYCFDKLDLSRTFTVSLTLVTMDFNNWTRNLIFILRIQILKHHVCIQNILRNDYFVPDENPRKRILKSANLPLHLYPRYIHCIFITKSFWCNICMPGCMFAEVSSVISVCQGVCLQKCLVLYLFVRVYVY